MQLKHLPAEPGPGQGWVRLTSLQGDLLASCADFQSNTNMRRRPDLVTGLLDQLTTAQLQQQQPQLQLQPQPEEDEELQLALAISASLSLNPPPAAVTAPAAAAEAVAAEVEVGQCRTCTFLNTAGQEQCQMCGEKLDRPVPSLL